MNIDKTLQKIQKKITEWSKDKERLIVGMDGYSGAGKTTVLEFLAKYNTDILPVHMDDFVFVSAKKKDSEEYVKKHPRELLLRWSDVSKLELLRNLIEEYKKGIRTVFETSVFNAQTNVYDKKFNFDLSKKVLLVEGVFLFHPNVLGNFLDKRIYLDSDFGLADERRVKREESRWGEKYFPENNPDSFTGGFILNYKKYTELYNPKNNADLAVCI